MFTRRVLTFVVAFAIVFGAAALRGAEGDEREGDADANVVAASGAETGAAADVADAPKKKGNRFFRAFKAPFKAVGKLLGGGDGGGKLARMTEGDASRFESVGVVRVEDRTTARPRAATGGEGTARDCLDRGRALLAEGRLNEAVEELSRAVSLDPRLGRAHSLLAVAYDRKGLRGRARESYERAVEADGADAQALNDLGYSLYLSGNYRAAADKLKRAARLAPSDGRILNNLALAQCRLGKYDDAYKSFARAGGEFSGHANVAAMLTRAGRAEKAIEHLESARGLRPEDTHVLSRLADLYEQAGRGDKAQDARAALRAVDERRQTLAAAGAR